MKLNAALATVRTRPADTGGRSSISGEAPFKCRSGFRYLYVDEFGSVHWCCQPRGFSQRTPRVHHADLREQFNTPKTAHALYLANRLRDGRVALPAGFSDAACTATAS